MTGSVRLFTSRLSREGVGDGEGVDLSLGSPFGSTQEGEAPAESETERLTAEYQHFDEAFLVGERVYNKQYAHLYFNRLTGLSPLIKERVKQQWPEIPVKKILEVEPGVECAVLGTLYKDMKLKPSVLDEYKKDAVLRPHLVGAKFVSKDDSLVMEDEGARMKLEGLDAGDFVTGVCLAVRGVEEEGGNFNVKSVCFPGPAPQTEALCSVDLAGKGKESTHSGSISSGQNKFVALISGLNLGEEKQDCLPTQLLVDYVTGLTGDPLANQITRMVVAGNISREMSEVPIHESNKKEVSKGINTLKESDLFLTQIASSMPVDLMPGPSDPCNVSLPQQPFHRCLLPSTTCYQNLGRVTNPHHFTVDGVSFLGTSGQNIDDIMKYIDHEDRLGAIASTLEWCHSTPTAPDTVPCFPFQDKDPFLVKDCPHVYFVGNQPKLETGILQGPQGQKVRIIALPAFSTEPTCVLVNVKDLSCHPITFSAKSMEILD